MIAEIIDVEVKHDRSNFQFLSMKILVDGDIKFVYASPRTIEYFERLIRWCAVSYIEFTNLINEFQFKGKLIPIYFENFIYANRIYFNSPRINFEIMK